MNRYETVFILTPVLSEQQNKETTDKFKKILKGFKANLLHEEDWGLKKLAYPIQKKSTGFYHLLEFEMEGEHLAELEVEMKRDERIMRFLTTKMDKHHIAFAEKRRNKSKKEKPAEAKKEEAPAKKEEKEEVKS